MEETVSSNSLSPLLTLMASPLESLPMMFTTATPSLSYQCVTVPTCFSAIISIALNSNNDLYVHAIILSLCGAVSTHGILRNIVAALLISVDQRGIGPRTSSLQMRHSTTELLALSGKLYQLATKSPKLFIVRFQIWLAG